MVELPSLGRQGKQGG